MIEQRLQVWGMLYFNLNAFAKAFQVMLALLFQFSVVAVIFQAEIRTQF